ncbi:MAG: branched-chain amino acid ABC transporter permease [Deltaproteobacteria bacterium]|nr:branched-chain amino acid ABC transporter permease [Deltaproteobacteria bacterium]
MRFFTRRDAAVALAILLGYVLLRVLNSADLLSNYILFVIMGGLINAMMTVSLNVVTGFTGQFSIGHAGFMAIGAYVSGIFTQLIFQVTPETHFLLRQGIFLISLLAGSLAAAIVAYLIGIPTLRLKGDYLCIATLGFNQIVVVLLNNLDFVGGPRGFTGLPKLSNLAWIMAITAVSVIVMRNFIYSIHGSQCIAVREDEIAAESLRINTTRYKIIAFVLASFFAGTAGGLLAHLVQLAHPTQFTFLKSIDILLMLVIGGIGNIRGSIIAALALTLLPEVLRFSQDLRLVIYPIILIVFVIKNPLPYLKRKTEQFGRFLLRQSGQGKM